ncbi:MAG: aspartate-semialdehyde dehydrogenase [Pseudomonadota bacterium]|nr:aspartate-semialdehyde dehydrogenase [Pseudomonadota bacterium]MDE3038535.1 aspartate-semialdehyde dehydrogenase [Pseudomonadota bacterium]
MSYKIAVVGATGNVGREMLKILAERRFPAREVVALASRASVGKKVSFGEEEILTVKALEDYDFAGTDLALFSPGASVSKIHAPRAARAGCTVIDNTSHFRMDPEIPLVVPEVNAHTLAGYRGRNIIANPNCSTMQMVVALKPLHDAATIKRVVVSTYQSVSGAGKAGMDELFEQTKSLFMNAPKEPVNFTKRIAFNVIPHIDVFMDDGGTKEEWKMVNETRKILGSDIAVSATCVRVPVFVGHSESVNLEFERPMSAEEAREILADAEGVVLFDEAKDGGYATPIECAGEDGVYVSRLRADPTVKHGLNLWIVSDNLRKGAALNAVQIAEELVRNYGLAPKLAH